jgi:hypothetical protein
VRQRDDRSQHPVHDLRQLVEEPAERSLDVIDEPFDPLDHHDRSSA